MNNNKTCEKRWVVVTFDLYCRTECNDNSCGHELFLWRCIGGDHGVFARRIIPDRLWGWQKPQG